MKDYTQEKIAKMNKIYDFIVAYMTSNNISPTYGEICTGTGIKSKATIHEYIQRLENAGVLETDTNARIMLAGFSYIQEKDINAYEKIKKEILLDNEFSRKK